MLFVLVLAMLALGLAEFHHQSPEQFKLSMGWQEPGLWRPRWVMDRVFESTKEDGSVERTTDRLYFKMKSDRTMKIYKREDRPKFEMFKVEQGM